ncbi:MAG: hypothetical protein Q8L86_10190 [Vicinamibacterales bacterium]|nr:hypothetical protein [Vicinamibacterales bacterium]
MDSVTPARDTLLFDTARLLVTQLGRVERMHRAGIEPTFGTLQDLFETRAQLERLTESAPAAPPRCQTGGCDQPGVTELLPGRVLCTGHAREVERLLGLARAGAR